MPWSCVVAPNYPCVQGHSSPAILAGPEANCTSQGGSWGTMCPPDDLYGRCYLSTYGGGATCYSNGGEWEKVDLPGACVQGGGEWYGVPEND